MRSLWGVGPTAPIHFGYDVSVLAQKSLIEQGSDHTVLIADLHAMMTKGLSFVEARQRSGYYEAVLERCYGLQCRYVRGSDFQLSNDYITWLLGLSSRIRLAKTINTFPRATEEGARTESASVSALLYPLMQCLDALFLRTDTVIADTGQRRIYDLLKTRSVLAGETAGLLDHTGSDAKLVVPSDFQYHSLLVGTDGKPLAASKASTRITIHESPETLRQKIQKMYAPPGDQAVTDGRHNALLAYLEFCAFPWIDSPVTIPTRDGHIVCDSFGQMELHYRSGEMHPGDLKDFLFEVLLERIHRFRDELADAAYGWLNITRTRGA